MNREDRRKLLKHRARADRLELELMSRRDGVADELDAAGKRIAEAEENLSKVIAARQAEDAKRANEAMMTRQADARMRTQFERLIEILNYVAPEFQGVEIDWRELVSNEGQWMKWRAAALHEELAIEFQTSGVSETLAFMASAPGGEGLVGVDVSKDGGGAIAFMASAPGGTGGRGQFFPRVWDGPRS